MPGNRRRGRNGLRRKPPNGWPLDRVLVGVATLQTMRELFRQDHESFGAPPRAWDLALWSGVTPQGSADSLGRLHQVGLVEALPPERPGRAPAYRLERTHPLAKPMTRLFATERTMTRPRSGGLASVGLPGLAGSPEQTREDDG